jgi:hypothetical protein
MSVRTVLVRRLVSSVSALAIFAAASAATKAQTAVPLPAGMRERDIGDPSAHGNSQHNQGIYAVTADGAGIDGPRDQFHFVYKLMHGDVDVVARVVAFEENAPGATAGVMIRDTLRPESKQVSALVGAGTGFAFDRRVADDAWTEHTDGGPATTPAWVRLIRRGTHFEAFQSTDRLTWTSMGSIEIAMNDAVYVGLAVTSRNQGATTTVVLDDLGIGPIDDLTLPNLAPTVTIITPVDGAKFSEPATITMTPVAADPEGRLVSVEFYANGNLVGAAASLPYTATWSAVPAGSYTLTAVAADAEGARTTSAPVTITVEGPSAPPPNQPPSVALTSPDNGATFTAPATISLTASAADPENQLARVEFYQSSTLLGTATASPYSFTWSSVPAGSYTLTAVAIDAGGAQTTSAPVSISVTAPNEPPTVALTSPVNGATFTAPATISIAASASDPENRLARVEFYQGTTLLGTATASPYSFTWSAVPAGSYTLTAVAADADGAVTTSAAVSVTVNAQPPPPPPPTPPRLIVFNASPDHEAGVTSYLLEIFSSGATPDTDPPLASQDLGKPTPDANGEIASDQASFFSALAPGDYVATVTAIGPDGRGRSTPVAFTR